MRRAVPDGVGNGLDDRAERRHLDGCGNREIVRDAQVERQPGVAGDPLGLQTQGTDEAQVVERGGPKTVDQLPQAA